MNKKVENQKPENKNDKKELTVPAEETTAQKQITESAAEPTQKPTTAAPTEEVTDKKEQEAVEPPPTKAQEDELAKEKRLNKQLENLWANGRKQLLNQPTQSKNNHSK